MTHTTDHKETPALAVSGSVGSFELVSAPWQRRGSVTTVRAEGKMLLHPQDLITLRHGDAPHEHVDASVAWHLDRATARLDAASARLHDDGESDRHLIRQAHLRHYYDAARMTKAFQAFRQRILVGALTHDVHERTPA